MANTALSKNGVVIRLAAERWSHITDEHGEVVGLMSDVLKTVAEPGGYWQEPLVSDWRDAKSRAVSGL